MPPKQKLMRQLLEISIATLVTIVIWISYGIYTALTKPADIRVTPEELKPLPGEINNEQISLLRKRLAINGEDLRSFSIISEGEQISEEPLPTETPTPAPASPSAEST